MVSTTKEELDFILEEDLRELLDTSSLLLDLASEEEGFTEELDSFAFSSDELEFFKSFCEDEDWRSPLEAGMTEDEESSDDSGETEEEESSPHATKIHAKTSANIRRVIVDCFATLAMTFEKIFTEDLQI